MNINLSTKYLGLIFIIVLVLIVISIDFLVQYIDSGTAYLTTLTTIGISSVLLITIMFLAFVDAKTKYLTTVISTIQNEHLEQTFKQSKIPQTKETPNIVSISEIPIPNLNETQTTSKVEIRSEIVEREQEPVNNKQSQIPEETKQPKNKVAWKEFKWN